MTKPGSGRRPRALSAEERRLWEEVARFITPLKGQPRPVIPTPPAVKVVPAKGVPVPQPSLKLLPGPQPKSPSRPSASPVAPPQRPVSPPVSPPVLERRLRLALRRGSTGVDAVLDLHGMRQAEAHAALHGFLLRAGRAGHRLVLVVTGKGPEGADAYSERGVLRRSVPRWLALPEMRRLVVGVEEAGRRHGGTGALYVRLRRPEARG